MVIDIVEKINILKILGNYSDAESCLANKAVDAANEAERSR